MGLAPKGESASILIRYKFDYTQINRLVWCGKHNRETGSQSQGEPFKRSLPYSTCLSDSSKCFRHIGNSRWSFKTKREILDSELVQRDRANGAIEAYFHTGNKHGVVHISVGALAGHCVR